MKIMVTFMQIVSNLGVGLQIPWPQSFVSLLRTLSFINVDFLQMSSTDCVFPTTFYTGTLAACLLPPVLLLLLLFCYTLPKYLFHRDAASRKRTRVRTWRMVLFFLWLIYPTVCAHVLKIFVCHNVNGTPYLETDMRLVCYDTQWFYYAGLSTIFIIMYPIGIPLLFFVRLYRHRNRLERPGVRAEMGMLYDAYAPSIWWFEMVEMLHKLVLTSVIAFLPTASLAGRRGAVPDRAAGSATVPAQGRSAAAPAGPGGNYPDAVRRLHLCQWRLLHRGGTLPGALQSQLLQLVVIRLRADHHLDRGLQLPGPDLPGAAGQVRAVEVAVVPTWRSSFGFGASGARSARPNWKSCGCRPPRANGHGGLSSGPPSRLSSRNPLSWKRKTSGGKSRPRAPPNGDRSLTATR